MLLNPISSSSEDLRSYFQAGIWTWTLVRVMLGTCSRMVHSHWSRNVETCLSLVESFPSDACASNLKQLRIVGFRARKGPIIGALVVVLYGRSNYSDQSSSSRWTSLTWRKQQDQLHLDRVRERSRIGGRKLY